MGLLNYFKKDKPSYDSTDIRLTNLDVGFVFDYDLSTWEVKEVYEYDWGDNYFTVEFKIDNGEEIAYLAVEDDDELEIILSKKIKIRTVGEDIPEHISQHQKPPVKIEYENREFLLDGETPGYFRRADTGNEQWDEFIAWNYFDKDNEFNLTIEQWGETEFEASFGKVLKEFEISNILPNS